MADLKKVIPGNHVVGYLFGALFILFPLLAYQDAPELFGGDAVRNLAVITAVGGAASMVAFVRRGERLLSVFVGAVAGVTIAVAWQFLLNAGFGAKLPLLAAIAVGVLPARGVLAILRFLNRKRGGSEAQPIIPPV